jgi:hypothetical protein
LAERSSDPAAEDIVAPEKRLMLIRADLGPAPRVLVRLSMLGLAAVPASCGTNAPSAEPSPIQLAYHACTEAIRARLKPTSTSDAIGFASGSQENFSSGDEFYFAFRSGMIENAVRDRPDVLTGSNKPSASCIGSLSARQITSVTVNGADVVTTPRAY